MHSGAFTYVVRKRFYAAFAYRPPSVLVPAFTSIAMGIILLLERKYQRFISMTASNMLFDSRYMLEDFQQCRC